MARTDNIWSQCVIYAIANLILQHLHAGHCIDTVDIFLDPKTLKPAHIAAVKNTLRGLVVSEAKRFEAQLGRNRLSKLKIRRIEPVEKQKDCRPPDKFQVGTWVAHKLCSRGSLMTGRAAGRVKICDMSDEVRRTIQQWDGKSFYEG
jgi:hypothetical protein